MNRRDTLPPTVARRFPGFDRHTTPPDGSGPRDEAAQDLAGAASRPGHRPRPSHPLDDPTSRFRAVSTVEASAGPLTTERRSRYLDYLDPAVFPEDADVPAVFPEDADVPAVLRVTSGPGAGGGSPRAARGDEPRTTNPPRTTRTRPTAPPPRHPTFKIRATVHERRRHAENGAANGALAAIMPTVADAAGGR